jgi:hypothetical protein
MSSKKNKGESLPFTQNGYTRQFKSGPFRDGGAFKQVEKVREIGRGTMGAKLEDVHIMFILSIPAISTKAGTKPLTNAKGSISLASLRAVLNWHSLSIRILAG